MAFIRTTVLIALLQARLVSLKIDTAAPASEENKLFERVGIFGANQLEAAMKATFASEQRVAFIVPVGDSHRNDRGRTVILSQRTTRLVLLIADRSMDKGKTEALIGGNRNVGILDMKDLVIDDLFANPFGEPVDLAFEPGEGEPLMLQGADKPAGAGNLGRECWAQQLTAYAGQDRAVIP